MSRSILSLLGFVAAITLPTLAAGQTPGATAPREVIGQLSEVIRQGYFDPDKAAVIADGLLRDAGDGRYDRFVDPRDLQEALTRDLQAHDRHFSVSAPCVDGSPLARAI